MVRRIVLVVVMVGSGLTASADPVDLTSWSQLTLDFPGGQGAGSWVIGGGNTYVDQVINADPSFFLNNLNRTSYSMDGSWQVRTGGDDDYMGFVFGYQNSSNFYLYDWKKASQGYAGTNAAEGMTIKRLTGSTGNGLVDLSLAELWENEGDYGDMHILAKNQSGTMGWVSNTVYDFHLDFNVNPGEIHVVVKQGASTLWDAIVSDSTFSSGQFGFYNYSQEDVRYMNFVETPHEDPQVPVPAAVLLGGVGVSLVGWLRRRRTF